MAGQERIHPNRAAGRVRDQTPTPFLISRGGGGRLAPRMRLLDRYLLREALIPLAYCLGGFFLFWVSFDLFGQLDDFQQAKLTLGDVAEYYIYKSPELLVTVIPVALLLALLYSLTTHARHNEIVAIRAAGVGLGRISMPYLAMGLACGAGLFWLNEALAPQSGPRIREIMRRHRAGAEGESWIRNVHFRNARDQRIWNIAAYHPEDGTMVEPHVEWRRASGALTQIIAKRGMRTNGMWLFFDVELFQYEPGVAVEWLDPVRTNQLAMAEFRETPKDIELQVKFNQLGAYEAAKRPVLSLGEIEYLRTHLDLNPRDRAMMDTQLQARLAQPWTCVVVVLMALPFGALTGRRNVFVGVASSIFICFVFFIVMRFGLALGTGGFIPATLAAWAPNALFGTIGIWMTLKAR